jgi:hypothetical protein
MLPLRTALPVPTHDLIPHQGCFRVSRPDGAQWRYVIYDGKSYQLQWYHCVHRP